MSSLPRDDDPIESPQRILDFLSQVSPEYLEDLRNSYRENPKSVSPDFALFFEALELGQQNSSQAEVFSSPDGAQIANEIRVKELIEGYRMRGHFLARIDPLGLWQAPLDPYLDLSYFQLDKVPSSQVFQVASVLGLAPSPLPKIVEHLKKTYCNNIGAEFHYIRDEKIRNWILARVEENQNRTNFSQEQKLKILQHLFRATLFESFLQSAYTGQKRFSLEGAEVLIPALKQAIETCGMQGAKEIVFGMAHRGRLNVLANVMEKPYQEIFKEFEGAELPEMSEAMGDVKYHQGYSMDIPHPKGGNLHLSLAPNPSHLEWVNPVVEGVVRAKQDTKHDSDRLSVVPILLHGDAAVIGQGVVAETLNLSQLEGYGVGGTIHIVVNNQIGFTTLPKDSRSSYYCTDFGKAFQCPIFHVNGDQVEDVVHAVRLASEFRMKFQQDVFVDIVCYRKYGHNEGDEPRFTQPVMYEIIERHPSPLQIYTEKLTEDRHVDQTEVDRFSSTFKEELDKKRNEIKDSPRILQADMFRGAWKGFELSNEQKMIEVVKTQGDESQLKKILDVIHHIPEEIHPLPKYAKMLEQRKERIFSKNQIDWAVAEQLAFGSLLLEGIPVRLSGQDSGRGTFSHRHLAMRDIRNSDQYHFLNHLSPDQAKLSVYDSPLSEAAVMGFDYGYSVAQPKALVIWEGQFGDFANSAQVIIDQFIASAESKWYRMSGLCLLLPHGYEGQGPEHSSARLERFLQLCAQNNLQVCYPTTPAQYFHLLRRQIHRSFRKPLVVMTPKSPLRMPEVASPLSAFTLDHFQALLADPAPKEAIQRVVFCSGKIYWDLTREAREKGVDKHIQFVRLEQIYPLAKAELLELRKKIGPDTPWIWVQEEPKNMGAWSFMRLQLLDLGIPLSYAGRPAAASPATGSYLKHEREQRQLIAEGLGL